MLCSKKDILLGLLIQIELLSMLNKLKSFHYVFILHDYLHLTIATAYCSIFTEVLFTQYSANQGLSPLVTAQLGNIVYHGEHNLSHKHPMVRPNDRILMKWRLVCACDLP